MSLITGLHHVTVISGNAQATLDFYVGVLGMRLVKRSVNQDDPGTYHLFFADSEGHPGSDLTFFPWPQMPVGQSGFGLTNEVALAVPPGSLDYWADRLAQHGVQTSGPVTRFGEAVLPFTDLYGLSLALVETADPRTFTAWETSPVPEARQIRGLHGVRITELALGPTVDFLVRGLGFEKTAEEDGWHRFSIAGGGSGRVVDVRELPNAPRGVWGTGSVHHIAFRVPDDEAELAARQQVRSTGRGTTEVIDRFWFKSVYFREPGGALFEIATDGPGFGIDEASSTLGEQLILPPFLESQRAKIERELPPLVMPQSFTTRPANPTAGAEHP
ncbi:MAG TPA: ring-cleaving dioxygenase [Gemmatimonadaceae bacterium]|jgi:glyoxalase family protein|nr:ring-cleaving dioxygenase [Gemmatimonadaceae bacterium]